MSEADAPDIPHPRETTELAGHAAAEAAFLDAYRAGRLPHAWLIGGPEGIGKATLAYRMARFVLAHPDASSPSVRNATTLDVAADHPVAKRIAAGAHIDLLALERLPNPDTGKLPQFIPVEQVRSRTTAFFGATAGEGGWRVALVDSVDELNAAGANALLKLLEEPPQRGLFLLVSHAPGRLLPTIRSRCRRLDLRQLAEPDVAAVLARITDADERARADAAAASEGRVTRAVAMLTGGMAVRLHAQALLGRLPAIDGHELHSFAERLHRGGPEALEAFVETVQDWVSGRMHASAGEGLARLARLAEVWDKVGRAGREADIYNLERKPLVLSVFATLADAAR